MVVVVTAEDASEAEPPEETSVLPPEDVETVDTAEEADGFSPLSLSDMKPHNHVINRMSSTASSRKPPMTIPIRSRRCLLRLAFIILAHYPFETIFLISLSYAPPSCSGEPLF